VPRAGLSVEDAWVLLVFNLTGIVSVYGEPSGLTRDLVLHMFVLSCFVCLTSYAPQKNCLGQLFFLIYACTPLASSCRSSSIGS
jgi:hypothetical protein